MVCNPLGVVKNSACKPRLIVVAIGQEVLYKFVPSVRLQVFCYSMLCDVAAVSLTWLPAVCEKQTFLNIG